jgi:hypothetical protein
VLAAKLILEHRETWLRNEATLLEGSNLKFKNPFGDISDGTESAAFRRAIGSWLMPQRDRGPRALPGMLSGIPGPLQ